MATKSSNGNLVPMETKVPMVTMFQWQLSSDGNKSFNGNQVPMATKVSMATKSSNGNQQIQKIRKYKM